MKMHCWWSDVPDFGAARTKALTICGIEVEGETATVDAPKITCGNCLWVLRRGWLADKKRRLGIV